MFDLSPYEYAEVRIERGMSLRVSARDETNVSLGPFYGISARVLKKGSWGFATSNDTNTDAGILLNKAEKLAGISAGNISIKKDSGEKKKEKKKPDWIDVESVLDRIKEAKKETISDRTVSSNITFSATKSRWEFYNSYGKEIQENQSYFYFSCGVIAREKGITQIGINTAANRNTPDEMNMQETAAVARENAEKLLSAKPSPKGRFVVVLDPEMTGTFAHEVVGHASEADSITSKESIFTNEYGNRIGNRLVNIIDDPTAPYFGAYNYDDEGVKGKKVEILTEGKLVGFMNSRESAQELNHELNGHARAESYESQPIVRMSNTFFVSGKSKIQDVFDIKDGIYVKGSLGGSVDIFSGGFMFKAKQGNRIKNGEVGELLRDVVMTGNIKEVLSNTESVGSDFATNPGICGKNGQRAPVEDGGPHIRVSHLTIG